MCRLVGSLSKIPLDPTYPLLRAPYSLIRQSRIDRKRLQGDGWGVGWFENEKPSVIKSPRPIFRDSKRLKQAAATARGHALLAHVRWASNPLKLAKGKLIGLAHTQPFVQKNWVFAHNGTLYIPREVSAALGPWKKYIRGHNDSEALFYWLMKHLSPALAREQPRTSAILSGVRNALRGIDGIWKRCKQSYPIYRHPYYGLNWMLTDGRILIALCYVNRDGFGKAKPLCPCPGKRGKYYQLHARIGPNEMTVASEPLDERRWIPIRHGELLIARRTDGGISTERTLLWR